MHAVDGLCSPEKPPNGSAAWMLAHRNPDGITAVEGSDLQQPRLPPLRFSRNPRMTRAHLIGLCEGIVCAASGRHVTRR